jgi:hypothetical protein
VVHQWKRVDDWLKAKLFDGRKRVLDSLEPVSKGAIRPLLCTQVPAVPLAFIHQVDILARTLVLGSHDEEQDRARWMRPDLADEQRVRLFDVVECNRGRPSEPNAGATT